MWLGDDVRLALTNLTSEQVGADLLLTAYVNEP